MHVRLARLDEAAVHRQFRILPEIVDRFQVPAPRTQVVKDVYELSYELLAPYYYSLMYAMYPDLQGDILKPTEGRAMAAFCGRDALGSSAALAGAQPEFHDQYCRDISISRITASQAYRDGRRHGDIPTPAGAEKTWQERVFAAFHSGQDPIGAYGFMARYLQRRDLPVGAGNDGGTVVVVDFACGNGTAQEFLRAGFPRTKVIGRYATTCLSPDDPHQHEKHGYVQHGQGPVIRPDGIPRAPYSMVSSAVWIPENLLSGPWGTAHSLRADGPVQALNDENRANRSFQADIAPDKFGAYRDWNVWAAGKTAALLAVFDYAKTHSGREPAWDFSAIQQGLDPLSRAVRGWTFPASGVPLDKGVRTIFDAYVPRPPQTKSVFAGHPLKESAATVLPAQAVKTIARTLTPIRRTPCDTGARYQPLVGATSHSLPDKGLHKSHLSPGMAMQKSLNRST